MQTIVRLVGKLTVGKKLALIYLLDLTAVIFVSSILIHEKYIAIDFAEKELIGNRYIATVRDALVAINHAEIKSLPSGDQKRALLREPPDFASSTLKAAENDFGAPLGTAALNKQFNTQLLELAQLNAQLNARTHAEAPDMTLKGQQAFASGRALLTRIGNQSNLILDPDLDSYYTMSLILLRFPEMLEVIGNVAAICLETPGNSSAMQQRTTRFLIQKGRLDAIIKDIVSDYDEAIAASKPELGLHLDASRKSLLDSLDAFRVSSSLLAGLSGGTYDPVGYKDDSLQAVASLKNAWTVAGSELERLLEERIRREYRRMWNHLGTAAALLAVILSLVTFVAKQIALPLHRLAGVADDVSKTGDYSLRARWHSKDEIGRLVAGFNSMLERLDFQRLQEQELAAQKRAAEAQKKLLDSIPLPLMVTSIPDHEVLHANDAARDWLNGTQSDPWRTGMEAASRSRFFQALSDVGIVDEFEIQWKGGAQPAWALVSARRLEYQGAPAVLATFTPIAQLKALEARLELSAKVLASSSEGIVILDPRGRIIFANPAFRHSTQHEATEILGRSTVQLVEHPEARSWRRAVIRAVKTGRSWQGEIWIRKKEGGVYPAWLVVNALRNAAGMLTHIIAVSMDITERKAAEERIHHLAHHDALTGLPNRVLFEERLQVSIQQAHRTGSKVAVLFIDLDRFKNINDSMGHHIGDGLLRSVAQRLQTSTREGDTVCRLGGDEFVVILNDVTTAEEVGKIVERRLIMGLCESVQVDNVNLYVTCSVGIAMYPDDGQSIGDLMRHADSAMYKAKRSGRNNFQFFTPELNAQVIDRLHLESDLRQSMERGELLLHYQPRVAASPGNTLGFECLVRWQHPAKGMVFPAQFIPVAEESGIIGEIGTWVLREACRQHRAWLDEGVGLIPLSINLSALQLEDAHLLHILEETISLYGIDPGCIELELTESLLMGDVEATIDRLHAIKSLGFSLAVDDFGTGFSSLNYLYRFPLDKLKIDKSFVKNINDSPQSHAVTKAIIGLGHALGMTVVAEGVEYEDDYALLKREGCDEFQGYLFSRPMPASAVVSWLRNGNAWQEPPHPLSKPNQPAEPGRHDGCDRSMIVL
jgi:diguanylate cyclase (GGDEF)-like protein/PAS domain S-box-containing protein